MPTQTTSTQTVAVWDWPVRLTHWSFALLVPAMWWTAENGEMGWHMRLGLLLLTLVLFRILWGLFGSSTARFVSFLRGPSAVWAYVRGKSHAEIGHSPVGGWSVIVLLAVLLVQSVLGLFAGDPFDGATGPLNEAVGVLTADKLTEWHETLFWVLVGLIGVHILAVLLYHVVGRNNLVGPMLSGRKEVSVEVEGIQAAPLFRSLVCFAISLAITGAIWSEVLV